MDQVTKSHSALAYQFFKSIGSPKYICAPMVDQSELAFRMLCRRYGCTLAYTPMLHSKVMVNNTKYYVNEFFTTCPEDRPLIAQFCGNDPETIVKAAKIIEDRCDAVDINCGCPQNIARKGKYGAFLLEKPEIIISMVKALKENLKIPVCVKIRMLSNREQTIELAKSLQDAGASIICIHGRTKEQNKEKVGTCDWSIIREIKEALSIPVFANGGIYTFADVERCLIETNVDAVMSAEALLENPALFSGKIYNLDDMAYEYMMLAKEYKARYQEIKAHLFRILYKGLSEHIDLREQLAKAFTYEEHLAVVVELRERRKVVNPENKFGWYMRYQNKKNNNNQALTNEQINENNKEQKEEKQDATDEQNANREQQ